MLNHQTKPKNFVDKVHDVVGTEPVRKRLLAHPRFHLHFTPTGSSWLDLVGRWLGEPTCKKLQRSVHRSVPAPERRIRAGIKAWNADPRPYCAAVAAV
ncbi:hypothetical protein [Streptomyces sp. NPDC001135]